MAKLSHSTQSTDWLIVSSFDSDYLKFAENGKLKYLPCVGMALLLDSNKPRPTEGHIYCFLPLSVKIELNYHVNAAFALTEDRTHLSEKTDDDKQNHQMSDHNWNDYLLTPLVNNLLTIIQLLIDQQMSDSIDLIEFTWPIATLTPYFNKFTAKFYETICSSNSNKAVFPTVHANSIWVDFGHSCFFDFSLENEETQNLALRCLACIIKHHTPDTSSNYPAYI